MVTIYIFSRELKLLFYLVDWGYPYSVPIFEYGHPIVYIYIYIYIYILLNILYIIGQPIR